MIQKPCIIITSLGRTGTEFFTRLFEALLPGAVSLHEPDTLAFVGRSNNLAYLLRQIRQAGARRSFLKLLGKWRLVGVSDARLLGRLSSSQAIALLTQQRADFVREIPGYAYVESNLGYYGILDITPSVFAHHRVAYIIRDGREWVKSHFNWGEAYKSRGPLQFLYHRWPRAADVAGDSEHDHWASLTRFGRLCWAWDRLNRYALDTITQNPNARLFRFEDIFAGPRRYQVLHDLVTFLTDLPGVQTPAHAAEDGWLDRKIHASQSRLPAWPYWTSHQRSQFAQFCTSTMERVGYDISEDPS